MRNQKRTILMERLILRSGVVAMAHTNMVELKRL